MVQSHSRSHVQGHIENEGEYSKTNVRFEFYALELTLYVTLKQFENFDTPPPTDRR